MSDALYNSQLEPWSVYLTGEQGKAPQPFYDPLELVTRWAHRLGLKVHAWINPYRAHVGASCTEGLHPTHIARRWPQHAKVSAKYQGLSCSEQLTNCQILKVGIVLFYSFKVTYFYS